MVKGSKGNLGYTIYKMESALVRYLAAGIGLIIFIIFIYLAKKGAEEINE